MTLYVKPSIVFLCALRHHFIAVYREVFLNIVHYEYPGTNLDVQKVTQNSEDVLVSVPGLPPLAHTIMRNWNSKTQFFMHMQTEETWNWAYTYYLLYIPLISFPPSPPLSDPCGHGRWRAHSRGITSHSETNQTCCTCTKISLTDWQFWALTWHSLQQSAGAIVYNYVGFVLVWECV